jgi:EAL domain-containing protein (putative c-di-GMP-specific phosphodiesterase class I)
MITGIDKKVKARRPRIENRPHKPGQNSARIAQSPLDIAVRNRDQKTIEMVRSAIDHKNTLLAYQPVMMSNDPTKVGFYEGLIRVLDETGRIIPAKDFIEVIEGTEFGRKIDSLSLNMGLKALFENQGLRLSINMSAHSIGFGPWRRNFYRWIERDDTIAERLILEITESSAMESPQRVVKFMDELQLLGVSFAMDDFGSGHTALRYFKDFFFDVLKIDGQFIKSIDKDLDNQALVKAMTSIAKHFDMLTVAEFVETRAEAETLITLGTDCLQGYFFSAPSTRPRWATEQSRQAAS